MRKMLPSVEEIIKIENNSHEEEEEEEAERNRLCFKDTRQKSCD